MSDVEKRSITLEGHRTSISLEAEFWEAFKKIARERKMAINALISEIDSLRTTNLSSALRVYILKHWQGKVAQDFREETK